MIGSTIRSLYELVNDYHVGWIQADVVIPSICDEDNDMELLSDRVLIKDEMGFKCTGYYDHDAHKWVSDPGGLGICSACKDHACFNDGTENESEERLPEAKN